MRYVTRISDRMQKHKFGATCLDALFLESVLVPLNHEKSRVELLHPRHNGMHYVTRRCHLMENTSLV
jgi:hypothetical protein